LPKSEAGQKVVQAKHLWPAYVDETEALVGKPEGCQ